MIKLSKARIPTVLLKNAKKRAGVNEGVMFSHANRN
jgi:hypothetical protein